LTGAAIRARASTPSCCDVSLDIGIGPSFSPGGKEP
jgi:hypothetical protein